MRRQSLLLLLSATVAAAIAGAFEARDARANGAGLPDTVSVSLVPGNTTELGIEANFGYLDAADGQNFTWICHDLFVPTMASITPRFYRGPGGRFLVTVRSLGIANDPNVSAFWSDDGCDWSSATGVDQVLIRDFSFDPSNGAHVFAVSASGGSTPQPNGVYVSNDGGHSWTTGTLMLTQRFFRSVRFAPNNPNVAYATANWYSPVEAWVYATSNGGASWSEHPWTFMDSNNTLQQNVDVVAVSPTNDHVVYATTDGSTDYLLRSIDAGATWSLVHTSPSDNIDGVAYESDGSAVWVSSKTVGTFRSADGVTFDPIPMSPPPQTRGLAADARGVFAAANNYADGFALGLTTNQGASFVHLFTFDKIAGVRACPAGSDVDSICGPLYPALLAQLGLTPSPTPTPGNGGKGKGGCSCEIGTEDAPVVFSALAGAALALVLVRRRRRQV